MFYLKNDKGLCAGFEFKPLIIQEHFKILSQHVQSGQASEQMGALYDELSALPSHSGFGYLANMPHAETLEGAKRSDCYGVMEPQLFKSNTPSRRCMSDVRPTPQNMGWDRIEKIQKLAKKTASEQDSIGIHLPPQWLTSLCSLAKKSPKWAIVEVGPEVMIKAQGFAVYLADSEGFANDKGNPVPLAGARLFESAAAAFRTIASRSWRNAAVVSANVEIGDLVPGQSCVFHELGLLGHGLSIKQAQQLRDAAPVSQDPTSAPRRRL